jgi:hypothetical protein
MPKYKPEKIEEAKKLRLEGKSNSEIANTLSIPRRTIIRWVKSTPKGGSVTNNNMSLLNDRSDDENANLTIKSEVNKESTGNSFHSLIVTFDTKTEGFTIEDAMGVTEKPKSEPEPGPGKEKSKSTKSRDPTKGSGVLDSPSEAHINVTSENIIDKAKNSNILSYLLPAALLAGGMLMSGKKGEKGEFREQTESW